MSERTDHLTDDAIRQLLETRSADATPGLLEDIVRTVGTTPQERPWLGLRPQILPPRLLLFVALALLLATIGAIAVGSRLVTDPAPPRSGTMWPQSNLDEVKAAQKRADAGDPDYTWQRSVDEGQVGQNHPCSGATMDGGSGIVNGLPMGCIRSEGGSGEIFRRFLQEKLGWEDFFWTEAFGHRGFDAGAIVFVRCAAGQANALYPTAACAPTIDDLRYETVKVSVGQPDRQGYSGIWVVTGWEMIEPAMQADPRVVEAEARTLLEDFLQARIDGAGAEGQATVPEFDPLIDERLDQEIPLLYATTTGVAYERSEIELVEGPLWPYASMKFAVSLFADNGQTVVEQAFLVARDDAGRLRLVYESVDRFGDPLPGTTENGRAVPVEYAILDGELTYRAAYPLGPSQEDLPERGRVAVDGLLPDDDFPRRILSFLADPRLLESDCAAAPASSDAEALARSIESDPRYEGAGPVAVTIAGRSAVQMDGVRLAESSCAIGLAVSSSPGRVYLIDLPGGSILAITISADEDSFETVMEWAAPIVQSIELHGP